MRLARFLQRNPARGGGGRPAARGLRAVLLAGAVGLAAAGCETGFNPEKAFIDPSELSGRTGPHQNDPLVVPVLDAIEPAIEAPDQVFINAAEPNAQDLASSPADYRISPNDYLSITITDLVPGVETVKQMRVTQTGNISLPYMRRPIHAAGLTEIELERAISDEYRAEDIVRDAQVTVTTVEARGRTFSIQGAVQRVGQYPIVETDFRLLNALMTAGGTTTQYANTAYIIRPLDQGQGGSGGGATGNQMPMRPARPTSGPGAEDLAPRGGGDGGGAAQPGGPGATGNDLAPGPAGGAAAAPDVALPDEPAARVTTIDGQQLPVRPTTQNTPATGGGATMAPADGTAAGGGMSATGTGMSRPGEPFAFNAPQEPTNVRVIRIPLDRLKRGELKYNVAIRAGDQIVIPEPEVGVYYMGGHVGSPGAFTLAGGQKVTLMDAIISARMLDSLAVPQRTDIVRRLDDSRQVFIRVDLAKIFEGLQPDLYIKPNDKVLVGTNILAPFLAATRNAFRITYGFGFLYDRNFALDQGTQNF